MRIKYNRARIVERNTLGRTLKRKNRGRQTISCFASDATIGERMKRTLRQRLEKEKVRLDKIALREPRTWDQVADRWRHDRIHCILFKRYERKET